jgi:hypothetical protein
MTPPFIRRPAVRLILGALFFMALGAAFGWTLVLAILASTAHAHDDSIIEWVP